ncbi:MAG: non-canonical purine NTP pyrophosphatase, RdgB/HAM1 family [Candidatus Bathyarchaeum sp.]|nr:MAG: non-canonical purine NTP pyrophosphatase, RdgB/HAM1 family [Candidatus Bathyarchaeum sp.]
MKHETCIPAGFPRGKVAYFVTSNIHKFLEARKVLFEYKLATAKLKVDAVEIQDDSLESIAKYSVLDAVKNCGLPVFVEDAGLFVEALDGFPGPYSKYVYNTVGVEGILKLMKNIENRKAYFMSVIAFGSPTEQPVCFVGKVEGKLSLEMQGSSGFGYDPIFVPSDGDGRTFAEMTTDEKNGISHRAEALRKFAKWYSSRNKRRF